MQLMRWLYEKDMLLLGEIKKGFASYSYMSNALRYSYRNLLIFNTILFLE